MDVACITLQFCYIWKWSPQGFFKERYISEARNNVDTCNLDFPSAPKLVEKVFFSSLHLCIFPCLFFFFFVVYFVDWSTVKLRASVLQGLHCVTFTMKIINCFKPFKTTEKIGIFVTVKIFLFCKCCEHFCWFHWSILFILLSMTSLLSERKQLKWVKWRTGMVLLFGNIILLSIEELRGRLFRGPGKKMRIYKEGDRWEEHEMELSNVYGVDISVSATMACLLLILLR